MAGPLPEEERQADESDSPVRETSAIAATDVGRYEAYHEWSDDVLRPVVAELAALAPGPRAIKTALAAGLAWWFGNLLGEPRPMFAAIGALVAVEPTIVGSVKRTGLQLVGILGGVALAAILTDVTEMSAVVAGAAVLFGLWIGRLFRSPDRVGVELSVTALLVVALGQGNVGFGISRLWEVGLGGLVSTLINAFVLPPNYREDVVRNLDTLSRELAEGLRETVRVFAELPHHEGAAEVRQRIRETRESIPTVRRNLELATEALRFSPLLTGNEAALRRSTDAMTLYNKAASHAARIARVVSQHAERPHPWSHEQHLESAAQLLVAAMSLALALEQYQSFVREGDPPPLAEARWAMQDAQAALADFYALAEKDRTTAAFERLVDVSVIASELEHLAQDVAETLEQS